MLVLVLVGLGLDVATMLELPANAIAADGRTGTVHGDELPTPPGAAVLLRAQHVAGHLHGRSGEALFLHSAGEPLAQPARDHSAVGRRGRSRARSAGVAARHPVDLRVVRRAPTKLSPLMDSFGW